MIINSKTQHTKKQWGLVGRITQKTKKARKDLPKRKKAHPIGCALF